MDRHRLADRLARLSGTPRLVVAALLLIVGAVSALASVAPTRTVPVVVAAHDVAAGSVLTAADVRVVARPPDEVPVAALSTVDAVVGHRVAGAVAGREVITTGRLTEHAFAVGSDRRVAVVRVASAAAAITTVGGDVDVAVAGASTSGSGSPDLSTSNDPVTPTVLATGARVLAVWPDADNTVDTVDSAVVLDVDVGQAAGLAILPADVVVGLVVGRP